MTNINIKYKGENIMAIVPYLIFDGNAHQAIEYYAEVFQVEKPEIITYGSMPLDPDYEFPEEAKNLVMHAELNIKDSKIMFSDSFSGSPIQFLHGNNVELTFIDNDAEYIRQVFERLSKDGKVTMDIQETFWSKLYGALVDKLGMSWQFSLSE